METDNFRQACILFETLNSRGKELEVKDLLKNYFFRNARNIDSVKEKWMTMTSEFSSIKSADISKFFRYYWNASHEFVRSKTLFRAISYELGDDADEFLKHMFNSYQNYLYLVYPRTNDFIDQKSVECLKTTGGLGATSFYPIILAACAKNASKEDISKILNAIECLIVRNQAIMGYVANKNETEFSKIALETPMMN